MVTAGMMNGNCFLGFLLALFSLKAEAFSPNQLARPWEGGPSSSHSVIFRKRQRRRQSVFPEPKKTSVHMSGKDEESASPLDDEEEEEDTSIENEKSLDIPSSRVFLTSTGTTASTPAPAPIDRVDWSKHVNGAPYEPAPTIRSSLGALFMLTRPANFPSIAMLHMLGVFLALKSVNQSHRYWTMLLKTPASWLSLIAILLTSSTSMVVNDYYDAKLGRDSTATNRKKALASGQVPLIVAKRFVSYLYSVALICQAFLPGIPTRLLVVHGLMLTFWYTRHLKPITWLKNIVCASLIALSPLTSGSAILHAIYQDHWALRGLGVGSLWRLVAMLFFGILGREITMDCNDVDTDGLSHVQTVPVVYGRRFASGAALVATILACMFAVAGPVSQILQADATLWVAFKTAMTEATGRRLALASVGSLLFIKNAWTVFRTEARDRVVNKRSVDQGLVTVLFLLLSFV